MQNNTMVMVGLNTTSVNNVDWYGLTTIRKTLTANWYATRKLWKCRTRIESFIARSCCVFSFLICALNPFGRQCPHCHAPNPPLLWTTAPIDSSNLPRVEQYSPQQNALQFRHGKCPDTFWGWLALKEKRLFGNWIDPPFFFGGWLLLQLQTKPTCQCEHTILLEFCTCDIEKSVHDGLNLLGWHTAITCLRDRCHDLFPR